MAGFLHGVTGRGAILGQSPKVVFSVSLLVAALHALHCTKHDVMICVVMPFVSSWQSRELTCFVHPHPPAPHSPLFLESRCPPACRDPEPRGAEHRTGPYQSDVAIEA